MGPMKLYFPRLMHSRGAASPLRACRAVWRRSRVTPVGSPTWVGPTELLPFRYCRNAKEGCITPVEPHDEVCFIEGGPRALAVGCPLPGARTLAHLCAGAAAGCAGVQLSHGLDPCARVEPRLRVPPGERGPGPQPEGVGHQVSAAAAHRRQPHRQGAPACSAGMALACTARTRRAPGWSVHPHTSRSSPGLAAIS